MKLKLLFWHFFSLLIGGLIYISFRSYSLKMFRWFENIGIENIIIAIRKKTQIYFSEIPEWILYSLPDGLWIFSYICLMLFIWNTKITYKNIVWLLIIPLLAILSEIGQLFSLINGTFDFVDLTFYILGLLLPFILFNHSFNLKFQTHEKKF